MKRLLAIVVLLSLCGLAEAGNYQYQYGYYPTYTYHGRSFSNSTTYTPYGVIQTYQPYNCYAPAMNWYWGW